MELAIKGHPIRGKEVLRLLERLGGINFNDYNGRSKNLCYYVAPNNQINIVWNNSSHSYNAMTLEEFETKYPYKIGDKVLYKRGLDPLKEYIITDIAWNSELNTVLYSLGLEHYKVTTSFLKPIMKQKELKDYLKPGYIVEYDNGTQFILSQDVHGNVFGTSLGCANSWTSLECGNGFIVKVYEVTHPRCYHLGINIARLPIVWEKPKEVELTMQEIADKFGINVNQLKIKK